VRLYNHSCTPPASATLKIAPNSLDLQGNLSQQTGGLSFFLLEYQEFRLISISSWCKMLLYPDVLWGILNRKKKLSSHLKFQAAGQDLFFNFQGLFISCQRKVDSFILLPALIASEPDLSRKSNHYESQFDCCGFPFFKPFCPEIAFSFHLSISFEPYIFILIL